MPAKKHCDALPEDIEPCPLFLHHSTASPSKGLQWATSMAVAVAQAADDFFVLIHLSLSI